VRFRWCLRGAARARRRGAALVRLRCFEWRLFFSAALCLFVPKCLICFAVMWRRAFAIFFFPFLRTLAGFAILVSTVDQAIWFYTQGPPGRRMVTSTVVGPSVAGLLTFNTFVDARSNVMRGQYVVTD